MLYSVLNRKEIQMVKPKRLVITHKDFCVRHILSSGILTIATVRSQRLRFTNSIPEQTMFRSDVVDA